MKIFIQILSSFLLLTVVSCNWQSPNSNLSFGKYSMNRLTQSSDLSNVKKITVDIERAISIKDLYELNKFIFLDSEVLIGEIDKIIHYEDKLIILDKYKSEKVLCYNLNGKYLYSFGEKGRGPGEFMALYDIAIDEYNQELLVYDGLKILYFKLSGEFIRSRRIDLFGKRLAVIDSFGSLLFASAGSIYNQDLAYDLILIDINDSIQSRNFPIQRNLGRKLMIWEYFSQHGAHNYYFEQFNDTIYRIEDDAIRPYFLLEHNLKNYSITTCLQTELSLFVYGMCDDFNSFTHTFYDKQTMKSKSFVGYYDYFLGEKFPVLPYGIYNKTSFIIPGDPYLTYEFYNRVLTQLKANNATPAQIDSFFLYDPLLIPTQEIVKKSTPNSNPVLAIVNIKRDFYETK